MSNLLNSPNLGWVGVDLDGTLAEYLGWGPPGKPIKPMVDRVKAFLNKGVEVKIFTARAQDPKCIPEIEEWCVKHIGRKLEVTNVKDLDMIVLYDDRAKQVVFNKGWVVGEDV